MVYRLNMFQQYQIISAENMQMKSSEYFQIC